MSYTNKTQPMDTSVESVLEQMDPMQAGEVRELIDFFSRLIGCRCVLWNKIFGFGTYYYNDSRGDEHSFLLAGFAISKTGFTLYNMMGWAQYTEQLVDLGKYKLSGKSCLAIKHVSDVNLKKLKRIYAQSLKQMRGSYRVIIG